MFHPSWVLQGLKVEFRTPLSPYCLWKTPVLLLGAQSWCCTILCALGMRSAGAIAAQVDERKGRARQRRDESAVHGRERACWASEGTGTQVGLARCRICLAS